MIPKSDQIQVEKFATLVELVQEYLDTLRCQAHSPECLETIRRVETVLAWAVGGAPTGGGMTEGVGNQVNQFAFALGNAAGAAVRVMSNDEVLAEFIARGSTRKDFEELIEAMKKVTGVFYNTPQPV